MVSIDAFRKLALSFPDVVEQSHFEKASFRTSKKIFATLDSVKQSVTVKLSEIDQSVFCSSNNGAIYPVSGAWGKQGWTTLELKKINKNILTDALTTAYTLVRIKKSRPSKK